MPTYQSVQDQLRYLGATPFVLMRAEVKILPDILEDGEQIREFITGTYDGGFGMMVATDKRLLFIDKKVFDLVVDDVPFNMISTLEFDLGMFFGRVFVYTFAKDYRFRRTRKYRTLRFSRHVQTRMRQAQEAEPADVSAMRSHLEHEHARTGAHEQGHR